MIISYQNNFDSFVSMRYGQHLQKKPEIENKKSGQPPGPKPVEFKKSVWNANKSEITHSQQSYKEKGKDSRRFISWILKHQFPKMFSELSFEGDVNDKRQLQVYGDMLNRNIAGSYEYFGYTINQLPSRKCILMYYHPNVFAFLIQDRNRKEVLFKKLDLHSKPRKKLPKLFGYLFGDFDIFSIRNVVIESVNDIEHDGYNFTDGCGEMSISVAKELFRHSHNHHEAWDGMGMFVPSLIQIRFPGIKGVLLLNKELPGRVVRIRPSMQKLNLWELVESETFPKVKILPSCILGSSIPTFSFHRLDAQSLTLLIQRGIDPIKIRKRAKQYIDSVRYASIDVSRGMNLLFITRNSEYRVCLGLIQSYIQTGCRDASVLNQIYELLSMYQKKELSRWNKRARDGNTDFKIRLPCESAYLYGGCDATGYLKSGQCYAAVTINNEKTVLKGMIAVYRNPCYHPSDILILEAVEMSSELVNVILFPTVGKRPHQHETSGGDLDGDKFTVIWDSELVPKTFQEPFDYRAENLLRIVQEYSISKQIPVSTSHIDTSALLGFGTEQKGYSIRELTKPSRNILPRIDSLIRKWRKHMGDDSNIDDVLNAMFNCVVDNEDNLPDIDRILRALETDINLKSETLSPFNAENDWFVSEMTQCVKHIKLFESQFLKIQMLRLTIVEGASQLIALEPSAFTLFETSVHEEIELAQRVIHHFSDQLEQVHTIGMLSNDAELLANSIGKRFSKKMEILFRTSVENLAKEVKQKSPENVDQALLAMERLNEMSGFDWTEVSDAMNSFEKLEDILQQGNQAKVRQDQFVKSVQKIVDSYDRKVEQETHTVHTTMDVLSLLLELEVQFLDQARILPIYDYRPTILGFINTSRLSMIIAGTGSGKSTCVPQYLLNEMIISGKATPTRRIGIAQPRRKATVALAEFMSTFRDSSLGGTVGFHIGKEKSVTRRNYTMIECMTFGILLGKSVSDPYFSQYSVLFIDEVHENSPDLFMLFGSIFLALNLNPDLKIVLMSATINPQPLLDYFGNISLCKVEVPHNFPIKLEYRPCDQSEVIGKAIEEAILIHQKNPIDEHPDILVFLPLVKNILQACTQLEKMSKEKEIADLIALPFYSRLEEEKKKRVTNRSICGKGNFRRVIFSTNIAETSLTLPELGYVIDSGLQLHVHREVNSEIITRKQGRCSQSAAIQRRGRIGRTSPGTCICLYSKSDFIVNFASYQNVDYSDLSFPILGMIKNKIDIAAFPWYQKPSDDDIAETFLLLEELGMLVKQDNEPLVTFIQSDLVSLTTFGELAITLRGTGLTIRQVRFLFESVKFGILKEAIVLFSFILSGVSPKKKKEEGGDEEFDLLDSEDDDDEDDDDEFDGNEQFDERFEYYKWYRNSDSSLETLLYHYNEWLKDKKYEPFKGSRMNRFKRVKRELQSAMQRHDILKKLENGTFHRSDDPIGECLLCSYFSNIGDVTLSSAHPKTREINSALKLINQSLGPVGIIESSETSRYGFKNYLLLMHLGVQVDNESIHSASEYDPDENLVPEGLTFGDFFQFPKNTDSTNDAVDDVVSKLHKSAISEPEKTENTDLTESEFPILSMEPVSTPSLDLMQLIQKSISGPVVNIFNSFLKHAPTSLSSSTSIEDDSSDKSQTDDQESLQSATQSDTLSVPIADPSALSHTVTQPTKKATKSTPSRSPTHELFRKLLDSPVINLSKDSLSLSNTCNASEKINSLIPNNTAAPMVTPSASTLTELCNDTEITGKGNVRLGTSRLDQEEKESYTLYNRIHRTKTKIIPKIISPPFQYFYLTTVKHGKTLFVSQLHRVRVDLSSLPFRWRERLSVFDSVNLNEDQEW
jgi:HrpA-like RNA helicase